MKGPPVPFPPPPLHRKKAVICPVAADARFLYELALNGAARDGCRCHHTPEQAAAEKLKGLIRRCSAAVQTPAAPALGAFSLAADLHGVILNLGGPQQGRVQHKQFLIVFDRASVVQSGAVLLLFSSFSPLKNRFPISQLPSGPLSCPVRSGFFCRASAVGRV